MESQFREPVNGKPGSKKPEATKLTHAKSDRPSDYRRLSISIQKATEKAILFAGDKREDSLVRLSERSLVPEPTKSELLGDLQQLINTLEWYVSYTLELQISKYIYI